MTRSDTWKVCTIEMTGAHGEISVCRKSFTHGFKSWGWDSFDKKIIIFDVDREEFHPMKMKDYKKLQAQMVRRAEKFAEVLNQLDGEGT